MSKKTIRLSVDVSPEFYQMLDSMAESSHSSKSDILKKSVVLMNVALDEKNKGNHLGVINKEQHILKEIVNL